MIAPRTFGCLSPFEAARAMSSTEPDERNAGYWAGQMVLLARQRDRACFMRIYDHFAPRVRLYLKGLGSPEAVAEELAQEALLRLWQRAELYDAGRGGLSTWLFRIARNLHIDRVRSEPQWVPVQDALERMGDPEEAGPSQAESLAEYADLRHRIEKLPAMQARLIRMSYFEARSHQQISDELGMPLGTVKSTLRRAFLRLQLGVRGAA
jgi:RNA polymerase sigma-70 factor (ECF subfamily)